jgi:hypothetical protein
MSARIKGRFCWSGPNRAKPSLSHDVLALVVVGEDHICGQRIIAITDGRKEKQRDHYLRHSICQDGVSGTECANSNYKTLRENDGRLRGRDCGTLKSNGRDVGAILIEEKLAAPFICGATSCPKTPRPWCGAQ